MALFVGDSKVMAHSADHKERATNWMNFRKWSRMTYRVRENTRPIYNVDGSVFMWDYYVYTSPEFSDYYEALKYAVELERQGHWPNWVDCMDTYEIYDNEVMLNH